MHFYIDVAVPFILVAVLATAITFIYITKSSDARVLRKWKIRR